MAATAAVGPAAGLGPQAFLNLLVTELRHQDPLQPVAGREFLAQLAQLAQVERLTRLEQQLERVARAAEAVQGSGGPWLAAAALVGRAVELADGGRRVVVGAGPGDGGLVLWLDDGRRVGMAEVRAVLGAGQP